MKHMRAACQCLQVVSNGKMSTAAGGRDNRDRNDAEDEDVVLLL